MSSTARGSATQYSSGRGTSRWKWPSSRNVQVQQADVELHAVIATAGPEARADATAPAQHDSAGNALVLSLVAPALNHHDLAALRLVNSQMCEAVSLLPTTVRCTPTTPLQLRRPAALAFPNAHALVLDLSPLTLNKQAVVDHSEDPPPEEGDVYNPYESDFVRVINGTASLCGFRGNMLFSDRMTDIVRNRWHYCDQLCRLRLWQRCRLLPSLAPVLQQAKHVSVVYSSEAGDVLPAAVLRRLLSRCTSLETFTYHCKGAEQLTFTGQGATPAERHASLLPQLAAMHPSAPLLHPASWATHNCLVSASCRYPSPSPGGGTLAAALATTSLQSLHIDLSRGTTWRDEAFASHLAALPLSLTCLSLSCNVVHLVSHGLAPQPPETTPAPALPHLKHLQLKAGQPAGADPATLVQLASTWTHLTHLTHLSIDGLPWDAFQHLPNIQRLDAHTISSRGSAASQWQPDEAVRRRRLLHLAGHLRHLALAEALAAPTLQQLTALTYLELSCLQLTPDLCRAFTHLPRLQTLRLDPEPGSPAAFAPTAVQQLESPDRPPLPPTFSTLRLSPHSAATVLNALALWTLLPPGGNVRITLVADAPSLAPSGTRQPPVVHRLGPLHQWSPCWRGSILPPGWYQAPCLQAVDLSSIISSSSSGGSRGADVGASGTCSGNGSASTSGGSSGTNSSHGSRHPRPPGGPQVHPQCRGDVYVHCGMASASGLTSSHPEVPLPLLKITGGLAHVNAGPGGLLGEVLLRLAGCPQEFSIELTASNRAANPSDLLLELRYSDGSHLAVECARQLLGLNPADLAGLAPGCLPGLVALTCDSYVRDEDTEQALCMLAAAAPNLRQADLHLLPGDPDAVLCALAGHCPGLETVSVTVQAGGERWCCRLQTLGQVLSAMSPAAGQVAPAKKRELELCIEVPPHVQDAPAARQAWWRQQRAALGCDKGWRLEPLSCLREVAPQHWKCRFVHNGRR